MEQQRVSISRTLNNPNRVSRSRVFNADELRASRNVTDFPKIKKNSDEQGEEYGAKINNFMDSEKEITPANSTKYRKISYQPTLQDKLLYFIEHPVYKILYVIITFYVLFAYDLKIICTDKSADLAFTLIAMIIMLGFLVEIVFYFIVYEHEYTSAIFFWIDVIGLASMVLDIHWINDMVIVDFSSEYKRSINFRSQGLNRLSRGVRIITRAIRMIRIIKLMKLIKSKSNPGISEDDGEQEESKVGQILENLTLKRMVILILLMVNAIIFFNPNFYFNPKNRMDFGLQIFNDIPSNSELFNFTFNIYVKESLTTETPCLYAKAYNLEWGNLTKTLDLRPQEMIEVFDICMDSSKITPETTVNTDLSSNCYAVFENKIPLRFAAIMNLMKTLFICIVLGGGIMCFTKDTYDLVLDPITKMTKKIKFLSKNPIAAMQQNLNERDDTEEVEKLGISVLTKKAIACCTYSKKKEIPMETTILEKTISKISSLLALGFGEAGAEIISTNMSKGEDGDINPMIAGKKVMAIYGFCDIRNFTDATEVLQEKVMIFVNEIAEVVHEITSLYCGSANKNIGDAFLLVWKFDEQFVERKDTELTLIKNQATGQLVDMALIAFLKILSAVHKSYKLNLYRKHEGLCERMPNYCVKMGFGLHLGYAIEGAIGSMFKIDASYLSPNVNMASKLEEKTKEYGVSLILSDDFVDHLSADARKYVRLIEKMKFDGKDDGVLSKKFIYKFMKYF
jgi:class 3 adenylate cyclase